MAITATNIDHVSTGSDSNEYVTPGGFAPAASSLLVFNVQWTAASGAEPPNITSIGGSFGGLTSFLPIYDEYFDISGVTAKQAVYAAFTGLAPTASAVTVHFDGVATGCSIIVDCFSGIDRSGTSAQAFVQFATDAGTDTTGTATLAALTSSSNAAYAMGFHHHNEEGIQGGAFTLLKSKKHTGPPASSATEWALNQTACDFSWLTSSIYYIWAAEIKVATTAKTLAHTVANFTYTGKSHNTTFVPAGNTFTTHTHVKANVTVTGKSHTATYVRANALFVDDGTTWTTVSGDKSVTLTPAVGEILVVICGASGIGSPISLTDDQGGTYTEIVSVPRSVSGGYVAIHIRDTRVTSAVAHVVTLHQAGGTGGGLSVERWSGLLAGGAAAVRQSAGVGPLLAPTIPIIPFTDAILTTNPVISAVSWVSNGGSITPQSGFTNRELIGFTAPPTRLQVDTANSAITTSGVTYGSAAPDNYGAVAVELFSSVAYTDSHLVASVTITGKTHSWAQTFHLTHTVANVTRVGGFHATTYVATGAGGSSLYGVATYGEDLYGGTGIQHVNSLTHVKANVTLTPGTHLTSASAHYFLQHLIGTPGTQGTWSDLAAEWDDSTVQWDASGAYDISVFFGFTGGAHTLTTGHINPPATYVLVHTKAAVSVVGRSHTPSYQAAQPPGVYLHAHIKGVVELIPGQHTFEPEPPIIIVVPPVRTGGRGELRHAVNQKDTLRGVRQSGQRLVRQRRP